MVVRLSALHTRRALLSRNIVIFMFLVDDRLCGLVVRVLDYRFGGLDSIPGTTRKKINGPGTGSTQPLSTNEELLDRKVAAPF
jgi:hypothetical protein